MAEKDVTEKILADYNDVFADIVNGFLFDGKQIILPNDLESLKDKSMYKADGKLHEQERDVLKYVKKNHLTILMAGFEHQTRAEKFMPIRLIGYDGQSYRAQLLKRNVQRVYPIVTLVLYFGVNHWPYNHHLVELLDIPKEYKPFVSDYEMKNLFEVAFLKPEQIKHFHSDFRYVADYFVQMRLTNDYNPSPDTIEHVDATLKLMSVLTEDHRFEDVIPELPKKGGATMCAVLDRVENRGRSEEKLEGRSEGISIGTLIGKVSVYYNDMGLSPEQIADKVNKPLGEVLNIIQKLKSADLT